jgi:hypothetical protein
MSLESPLTHVSEDRSPPARCRHCGRPFPTNRLHAIHLGQAHEDDLSDAEREAFEDAWDSESDELFMYHLKVIASLGALYAVLVLIYMVALTL